MGNSTDINIIKSAFFIFSYKSICLSSRAFHHRRDLVSEVVVCHQVGDIDVHPVAPVMARIGRDIDSLCILIGQAEFFVDGHPVLYAYDAQHRWAAQMGFNDVVSKCGSEWMWSLAIVAEHAVEIVLRALLVFVPLLTQCRHVVRGDCRYRAIGIFLNLCKSQMRIFRH